MIGYVCESLCDLDNWAILDGGDNWIGRLNYAGGARYVPIAPTNYTWTEAVDIYLEFLDMLRTGAVPKGVNDPDTVMKICRQRSRKQK